MKLLLDTVHPPGRGPYCSAEVVAGLRAQGFPMSAPYLSQLRSGRRANPSVKTIAASAGFFGVEAAYFTDDAYYHRIDRELDWLLLARDDDVRTLATDIAALSPKHREDLRAQVLKLGRHSS